uniref:hypothetical protein n=1 Tax=Acetatifactor sp. TaxID=1872090 RepID=UPI00405601DA
MYRYYIYGLGIKSEMKLYQLEQYAGEAEDVTVRYGEITDDIARYTKDGITSSMSANRVWFRNDIGYFIIWNGNEIVVQPAENATEEQVASFVLGWCIAFIFQQRGIPAMHCSALEMHNQAVLISGGSGAGKSTLTLSLLGKGYRYLADDIAMVDLSNDMLIQPAFPQQKVCRDVAESMEPEQLYYVDEKKDKFAYMNMNDFCPIPQKLSTIFLISKYNGEELIVEKLKGLDKWNGIVKNLFLLDAYLALGFPIEEKNRCLEIAGKVEVYAIRRPEGKDTVAEICNKIIELVQN